MLSASGLALLPPRAVGTRRVGRLTGPAQTPRHAALGLGALIPHKRSSLAVKEVGVGGASCLLCAL